MYERLLWALAPALAPIPAAAVQQPQSVATSAPPSSEAPSPSRTGANTEQAVDGVVVTADKDIYRSAVDRRSYGLGGARADGGSLAEALQRVPGVQVDPQGNLSLRGDGDVTVLVDGRPSGLFQGEARANTLLQTSADEYERVEVMTTPSAANNPEGSGGIINLIRKKKKAQPRKIASLRANLVSPQGYNGSVRGGFDSPRAWGSVSVGGRRATGDLSPSNQRQFTNATSGAVSSSRLDMDARTTNTSWNGQGNLGRELKPGTEVAADAAYTKLDYHAPFSGRYRGLDGVAAPGGEYDTFGRSAGHVATKSLSADINKQLSGEEHGLSAHVGRVWTDRADANAQSTVYLAPGAGGIFTNLLSTVEKREDTLTVDYKRSLPGGSKLALGLDVRNLDEAQDHIGRLGADAASALPSPALTNAFHFSRATVAAYGSYQRTVGRLTLLSAMRLENGDRTLEQRTLGSRSDASVFRVYPSLNLSWAASENWTVKAGYARRVQRPEAQDLNPFRVYSNPLSYRQGNPDLRDQITDSVEVSLERQVGRDFYSAAAFSRWRKNEITDVVTELGDGALLTRRDSLGRSKYTGIELTLSRKLSKNFTLEGTGEVSRNQIKYGSAMASGTRSGVIVSGHANLDWRLSGKDFLQVNITARGKRMMAQGHRLPSANVNLGYRRKLSDKLAIVSVVQDAFDTYREGYTITSRGLNQRVEQNLKIRSAFIGFTYALGGGQQSSEKFDYGSAGQ